MGIYGKIVNIDSDTISIEILDNIKCKECKVCCNLFDLKDRNSNVIKFEKKFFYNSLNNNNKELEDQNINFDVLSLSVGDILEIEFKPRYAVLFALIIFGLPILGFCCGIVLALYYSNWTIPSDIIILKFGTFGITIALVIIYILKKKKIFDKFEYNIRKVNYCEQKNLGL